MEKKSPSDKITRLIFASNMRALRRARNITQEKFAEETGLSRTYVSSVELGNRNISIDNIGTIARALGVKPSLLLDEDFAKQLRGES